MGECSIPEFYSYTEPVAHKEYRCCECSAPIPKGEKHFAYRGKWDGAVSTGRQHLLCMRTCMFIRDAIEDECIGFGYLDEYWNEVRRDLDKTKEPAKTLRSMIAEIRRRERRFSHG